MGALARAPPAPALVQLELGPTYAAGARSSDAKAALERAVELDASLADAWRELSEQRLQLGETASADAAYTRYRRLATDPPDLADAYTAFDQGRLETAEALVRRRLQEGTNVVAAFTLLAAIALRRGDGLAGEAALSDAVMPAPCDSNAHQQ